MKTGNIRAGVYHFNDDELSIYSSCVSGGVVDPPGRRPSDFVINNAPLPVRLRFTKTFTALVVTAGWSAFNNLKPLLMEIARAVYYDSAGYLTGQIRDQFSNTTATYKAIDTIKSKYDAGVPIADIETAINATF